MINRGKKALWFKIEDIAHRGGGESVSTLRRWRDEARELADCAVKSTDELAVYKRAEELHELYRCGVGNPFSHYLSKAREEHDNANT